MSQLDEDIRAAKEAGLSYGKYKAAQYDPSKHAPAASPKKSKRRPGKFTDLQAFLLWQQYKTDAEIAAAFGVSRIRIVQWRDQLELPSTVKNPTNTQKYRLTFMQDGTPFIVYNDEL